MSMEPFKSPVSRLARLFQKSRDAWKEKALDKQQRLRAARIRIRDLEKSRAYWKERALAAERGESRGQTPPGEGGEVVVADGEEPPPATRMLARPSHHRFPLLAIELTLRLSLIAGLGSRGVPRLLQWLTPWLPLGVPAHTTVLNWVDRCGLAHLQETPPRRTDWIDIVDHTLTLGAAKCLLILGITVERLRHTGFSPSHEAMTVLALEVTLEARQLRTTLPGASLRPHRPADFSGGLKVYMHSPYRHASQAPRHLLSRKKLQATVLRPIRSGQDAAENGWMLTRGASGRRHLAIQNSKCML